MASQDIHDVTWGRMEELGDIIRLSNELTSKEDFLQKLAYEIDSSYAHEIVQADNKRGVLLSHGTEKLCKNGKADKDIVQNFKAYALKKAKECIKDDDISKAIYYLGLIHLVIGIRIRLGELPEELLNKILPKDWDIKMHR